MQLFLRVRASTGEREVRNSTIYCIYHVSILRYCNYINAQGILDSIWYLLLGELVCGNAAASIRDQCGIF
jgi:nitrogenase subunit NifH